MNLTVPAIIRESSRGFDSIAVDHRRSPAADLPQSFFHRSGEIISKVTGKTMKEILRVTKEDSFFNAEEAVEFGLATGIVEKGESI